MAAGTANVSPSRCLDKPDGIGDPGSSTVTAKDCDAVFDRPRYEIGGGSALQPHVLQGVTGVEVLLDCVTVGKEAMPIRQALDSKLDFRQPELVFIEPVDGGVLHVTSQVQHELVDGGGLTGGSNREARDRRGMAAEGDGLKPLVSTGAWTKVFVDNRHLEVGDDNFGGSLKGVKSLWKGGPAGGSGGRRRLKVEITSSGDEKGSQLNPGDSRLASGDMFNSDGG